MVGQSGQTDCLVLVRRTQLRIEAVEAVFGARRADLHRHKVVVAQANRDELERLQKPICRLERHASLEQLCEKHVGNCLVKVMHTLVYCARHLACDFVLS